jgi:Family of unknown function (DUF5691)
MWSELVKTALLGTEKSAVDESLLPDAVRRALEVAAPGDPETRLLRAAALSLVYREAGQLPEKSTLPPLSPAPDETQGYGPPARQILLGKLLGHAAQQPDLVGFLLDKMAEANTILHPNFLVQTLNLGLDQHGKKLREKIAKVAGERGRWLAALNPAWRYVLPADLETRWKEGSLADRRKLLAELRPTEPARAFAWLHETWPDENARERKELLKTLLVNPRPEEADFVEANWKTLLASKDSSKPIQAEFKKIAVEILLGQPGSALYREVVDVLRAYFGASKGRLSLRAKSKWQIPATEDAFFCKARMVGQFGFDAVSPYVNCGEPEYWFSELAYCLHPRAWEEILGESWPDILDRFAEASASNEQKHLPLLQNLSRALAKQAYTPGIRAYLDKHPVSSANQMILEHLDNAELEQFARRKIDIGQPSALRTVLGRPGWVWSVSFSRFALEALLKEEYAYHNAEFAREMCLHFHPSVLDILREAALKPIVSWQQKQLRDSLILPLLNSIKWKIEIEKN